MDIKARVEEALFRQQLHVSAVPLIGSAAASLLIGLSHWPEDSRRPIIGWVGLVYLVIAIRIVVILRIRHLLATRGFRYSFISGYAMSVGLSGIAWGIGGTLINDAGPMTMVITVTGFQAMVMGGVLTMSRLMSTFLAFSVPAILPMVYVLATRNDVIGIDLAVYNAVFLLLMIWIAQAVNIAARRAVELTFDKEDLVDALTEAHDKLAVLAGTDALTELPNRRKFDEVLEGELGRLRRSRAPLSLILFDVDHFKAFNDTYGHVSGDECLKRVAAALGSVLNRTSDIAARYGGEEFAAILPDTDYPGAVALAERIRAEVAALNIEHRASPTAPHLTASLGVVTLDCTRIESPQEAVKIADEQLYAAKTSGRNRIRSWNGLS